MFHPILGYIALFGAVCIFILALLSEYSTRRPLAFAGVEMRSSRDFVDSFARQSETVRAMGMLPSLEQRWSSHHEAGVAWQAQASDRMASLQAITKAVRAGLQIAILGTGAWLALQQSMSAGAMVAASIIMGRALAPVEAAIGQWRSFVEARGALTRLKAVLAVSQLPEERVVTQLPKPQGHLIVENVGLKLAGVDTPILRGISLELEPGEMLGLIGPSGSGKSSLARLIAGASIPSVGTVRFDGADISDWPDGDLGPYVGYLSQSVELFAGTIAENIARFGSHESQDIVAAAKLASAHDMILALPHGYDMPLEDEGRNLSSGQRQRIGLARAIFGNAGIIILDEPNANLDAEGEGALKNTLARLKADGRTVIAISHKPSLLAEVDKLLVLREGAVDLYGSREAVLPELIRAVDSTSADKASSGGRVKSISEAVANGGLHGQR